MKINKIDARGLSCPEPVVMTQRALKSGENEYQVLVDNVASKENVSRFATHSGYHVEVEERDGEFALHLTKTP